MSVTAQDIMKLMEAYAPARLAEDWDNVGLQVGDPKAEVSGVLVTLDLNLAVAEEALRQKANCIVAHHPLIFKPIKNLRPDNELGKLLYFLVQNNLNLFVAHTNLDSADQGVNQVLAQRLGLQKLEVLAPHTGDELIKIVTFVPVGHQDQVLAAMTEAGAGWIGNYSHCTFQTEGTGTFLPLAGTQPFLGEQGKLEVTEEIRLETIVPKSKLKPVLTAMLTAHPYEEVAYDLYGLLNDHAPNGLGRIGQLAEPIPFYQFAQQVKAALGCEVIQVGGDINRSIQRVAVCGGSGVSLAGLAAKKGAEVLVTGDVKYHDAQAVVQAGLNFIDAGHYETENLVVEVVANYLRDNINIPVQTSGLDINPRKSM